MSPRLAREGALEGLWLRAERQTGGQGAAGQGVAVSPPGNLHASTLVRLQPERPAGADPGAGRRASRCTKSSPSTRRRSRIKWPNDLLFDGAKLAGILLERQGDAVILGFGVNLAHHPEDLDRPADQPRRACRHRARARPLPRDRSRAASRAGSPAGARKGSPRSARPGWPPPIRSAPRSSTGEGEGLFDGLDESGALRLRLADGSTRVIHAGDVFLI